MSMEKFRGGREYENHKKAFVDDARKSQRASHRSQLDSEKKTLIRDLAIPAKQF